MLAQITRYKGTDRDIDSTDYNNKKSLLFFEKLVHYYGIQMTNYISELGPTLIELVINDYIYKRIHHLPLDTIVNHGYFNSINIGQLCVWFAEKLEKYPNMGIEQILLQEDVFYELQQISLPWKERDPNFTF